MTACHLHVHSEFSFLDGYCRLEELIEKAGEKRIETLALTDHANMSGHVMFYRLAVKAGIKPILGAEVTLENGFHLVLLAKNNQGYVHLLELITRARLRSFENPYLKWEELAENSPGLIALSACERGEIPALLLRGERKKAAERAGAYRDLFGRNNFYLELVASFPAHLKKKLMNLSERSGLPLVASNNVHYIEKEEKRRQEKMLILQKISRGVYTEHNGDQHLLSSYEMQEVFKDCPQALRNCREIAERCQVVFDLSDFHMPAFPLPAGETAETYLEKLVRTKKKEDKDKYNRRLKKEMEIIKKTGFAGYFLIVHDIISFCERNNISVAARGSAVGSYVGYLLGFTRVDPVSHNLYFERFLNPERITSPDIDLDISHNDRKKVLDYLHKKYGEGCIAHIGAYSTFAGRAAVHDAAKAWGCSAEKAAFYSSLLRSSYTPLEDSLKLSPELQKRFDSDPYFEEVFELARDLTGRRRHLTQHSSGVVLAPEGLTNYTALQYSRDGEIITQLDMHGVEDLGLLKIDLLGARFQSAVKWTREKVSQRKGIEIYPRKLPAEDQQVYEKLGRGETMGVFQLESTGMRILLNRMRPKNMADLIAATSLYRPGPLKSGMSPDYIQRREKKESPQAPHPSLQRVLEDSLGTILWQEQVMETARVLAGYSYGEADVLRRGMAKRKAEIVKKHREKFIRGCRKKGLGKKQAAEIFSLLEHFSSYCFNKAHAAAHAQIIYQTAYLKTYFPLEYMVALLNSHWGDQGRRSKYLAECRRLDYRILKPHINRSGNFFSIDGEGVRTGLAQVRNLGVRSMEDIFREREKGEFSSLYDFLSRLYGNSSISRAGVESLIKAGAFSDFGEVYDLLWELSVLLKIVNKKNKGNNKAKKTKLINPENAFVTDGPWMETGKKQKLLWEIEEVSSFINHHPLDLFDDFASYNPVTTNYTFNNPEKAIFRVAGLITQVRLRRNGRGEAVYIVELEDREGNIEFYVDGQDGDKLRAGQVILVELLRSQGKGSYQLRSRKILAKKCLKSILTGE